MSKKIAFAIWALSVLLANILLFILEQGMTATFWITFVFTWLAFVSGLIYQIVALRSSKTRDKGFLHIPALMISSIYEAVQIPLCAIFALCSGIIPWKVTLLIHAVILIITWILILSALMGNEHIERVNSRQKDHHKEL